MLHIVPDEEAALLVGHVPATSDLGAPEQRLAQLTHVAVLGLVEQMVLRLQHRPLAPLYALRLIPRVALRAHQAPVELARPRLVLETELNSAGDGRRGGAVCGLLVGARALQQTASLLE
eukprot:scaffold10715_cov66-Phaeocystis_antarctica.AAC.3